MAIEMCVSTLLTHFGNTMETLQVNAICLSVRPLNSLLPRAAVSSRFASAPVETALGPHSEANILFFLLELCGSLLILRAFWYDSFDISPRLPPRFPFGSKRSNTTKLKLHLSRGTRQSKTTEVPFGVDNSRSIECSSPSS